MHVYQILIGAFCFSDRNNTFEEDINPFVLLLSMDK